MSGIAIKKYVPSDALQWNRFVERSKNGFFMFKREYMEYHADRFTDHSLCIFRDEELIAVLPANARDNHFISHGGLTFGGILSDERMKTPLMLDVFDALKTYLRGQGFSSCLYKAVPHIYHVHPAEEDRYALFRQGAALAKCEVTVSICRAHMLAYSERRRRGIKKALQSGITFTRSQDFETYFIVLKALLADKHGASPTHNAAEIMLLAGHFPENIQLWTGNASDGKMLAGVIMYAGAQVAHAQYIAASPEGRECGALDALFAYLMETVYPVQPYFDFGISTEQGGRHLNTGLITQKEEFGARAVVHETFSWSLE